MYNKEKHKQCVKRYKEKNKAKILVMGKQWRKKHTNEIRAYRKQYNKAHKDEILAYGKQWREREHNSLKWDMSNKKPCPKCGNLMWKRSKRCGKCSRGQNHWCWKGGVTLLTKLIRNCFKYRQWRDDVFTRDDFTCQKCWIRSGKGVAIYLEAHHLKKFYKIIEENQIKTFEEAITCEELWNINNGQTLCKNCHDKTKEGTGRRNRQKEKI